MSAKSEAISWGLILAGFGALAIGGVYLGKKVLGDITGFGSSDGIDIFGNKTASTQKEELQAAVDASGAVVQQNQQAYMESSAAFKAHPDYQAAYDAYLKELQEADQYGALYVSQIEWGWTGKETSESKERYQQYLKELQEAQASYNELTALWRKYWG